MASLLAQFQAERHSPSQIEKRQERMLELEQEVMEEVQGTLSAFLAFRDIDPAQPDPPPEWVEQWGEDAARKRLKLAQAGWQPMGKAPAGAQVAARIWIGMHRARAHRQLVQNQLNVQVIKLPAPTSAAHPEGEGYEVIDVE